ncbi:glycosyltransferase family 2 protein [Dyadobacter sp. LHD-138]|uniref:glycosyltransferase family 2 protein n=1 Tax=Dyadobacter sp. LHD-138 TaxID=3071413 RepID=UPI0027E0C663|nr:glycosyltransferase family 2 protein [Dyadobacter sp. LHD-138]MDQ6481562.1 glycosyltransferase family 2 protein [Dyadobacter sp. LHD-138]
MQPCVCIIILNWNGYEVTKECLHSLYKINYANYKIILVDNGSVDGSVDKLRADFSDFPVDFVALDKNHGFTGGNNLGIKYAAEKYTPDYFLLLNNDTTVNESFLEIMVGTFSTNSKCYAVVPKIYYYDRPDILWYAGGGISKITGIVQHYGINKKDSPEYSIPKEVDFMNGCTALISKESVADLGILDEIFFANSEDADYSLRILNSDHIILYAPEAVIYHKVSHSFKSNKGKWFTFYMATRNIIFLQRKHLPGFLMPAFFLIFGIRWMGYLTIKLFFLRDFKSIKGIYVGLVDGFLNRKQIRSSL